MNLVLIYGAPGVGKLTVAKELAELTGYKVFHNHLSLNPAWAVFPYGSESFWRILYTIRDSVLEEAARSEVSLVFTCVYPVEVDDAYLARIYELVERHNGRVCPVQLVCDQEEVERRVLAAGRRELEKITSAEGSRRFVQKYGPFPPVPGDENLVIDNTELPPDVVAHQIAAHYGLTPP